MRERGEEIGRYRERDDVFVCERETERDRERHRQSLAERQRERREPYSHGCDVDGLGEVNNGGRLKNTQEERERKRTQTGGGGGREENHKTS